MASAVTSVDFWDMYFSNVLTNGELWGSYATDIAMAVGFSALGLWGTISNLKQVKKPSTK